MKIVILYSGGLDSLILNRYAEHKYPGAQITKVYFNIGQPYAHKEIAQLPKDVKVHNVDWSPTAQSKENNTAGSIYIPGRNLVFATLAGCIYTPDEIWLGALVGEDHPQATDKNEHFRQLASSTLNYTLSPFSNTILRFPFIEANMGKLDITRWALTHGIPAQTIIDSSSCMDANQQKCGTCIVCARRWGIFSQLNLTEEYTTHPLQSTEAKQHMLSVLTDDGQHYNLKRKQEFALVSQGDLQ